ncbi:Bro-N domain-containing protein [Achromobacter ruhlandii]|uniref:BRO-N domain-containing protein n=1 Tax=Achromobacter ruhlandii TaxID=72557 RepID=UPI003B9D561D
MSPRTFALANPSKASLVLDTDEKSNFKLGLRGKAPLVVSESGLYSPVLRSRKPGAHAFRKWVTSVVLPAIRRDGAYIKGEEAMDERPLHGASSALCTLSARYCVRDAIGYWRWRKPAN